MRTALVPTVLLLAALFAGGAWSQERTQSQDLAQRVDALEAELQRSQRAMAALEAEQAAAAARLRQMETYLASQAGAARTLATVLDDVERLGFTAGINPDSRVRLLAGLRAQIAASQRAVPGSPPARED